MKTRTIISLIAVAAPLIAVAQDSTGHMEAFQACARVEDATERLQCFDALGNPPAEAKAQAPPDNPPTEAKTEAPPDDPPTEAKVEAPPENPVEPPAPAAPVDTAVGEVAAVGAAGAAGMQQSNAPPETEPRNVSAATPEAPVAATPEAPVAATAATEPALSEEIGGEKFEQKQEDGAEQNRGRVTSCQKDPSDKFYFVFDNGQVWYQTDGRRFRLKEDCEFTASVSKDLFGYKMQIEGEEGKIRVKRIR